MQTLHQPYNKLLEDPNPEPHDRQSVKGLFTFYREQEQMEIILGKKHAELMMEKAKLIQAKIKSKIKAKQEGQRKSVEKRVRKVRSRTGNSVGQDHDGKDRSKKKKKSRKALKQAKSEQIISQTTTRIDNVQKSMPIIQEQQDPTEKFMKRIRHRKITRSPTPKKQQISQQQQKSPQKQQFNKLFYPKQSQDAENIVDLVNQSSGQYEEENKFRNMNTGKNNKKVIVIDEMFMKRSSSEINKSLRSRKRLQTEINQVNERYVNGPLLANNVKQNFYSHPKLKKIVDLANKLQYRQETQPISPPSQQQIIHLQPMQYKGMRRAEPQYFQSIRLPQIKNTRLSRELKKIEQTAADELERYGSNKTKKSTKKINQSGHHPSKKHLEYTPKQKSALRKKLQTEPQTYCVATIDLSKSVHHEQELKNISWSSKKKLLFKKLGINL